MRLGIDLDGVVADFNTGWIDRYNADFGADILPGTITMWDGLHELTHFTAMEEFWEWAKDHGAGSVFRHLDTYEDALPALEELSRDHEVVILTTKPDWAVHDTFAWIADRRLPTREVHILAQKWTVPCDVYLDDAPHQVRAIHRYRPEAAVCRFVRPWNEPVPGTQDVRNWPGFVQLVRGLPPPTAPPEGEEAGA